jgi:hypothetical protein
MKSKHWIILGVGLALLVALTAPALILVNFSAMSNHMEHDSMLASSKGGDQSNQPINPAKTGLVVIGEDRLARALQNQITSNLQSNPAFGQFQPINSIVEKADYPILLIEIAPQEIFWTPIYARANLKVSVSYASDGDVSFRLHQPTEFKNFSDQPTLKQSGHYTFSDVSWGIISSPGYMNYLAREIARPIAADLKKQNQ